MSIKKTLYKQIEKILHPNRYSSDAFVNYLRANGCEVGENTFFFAPLKTTLDERRLDYIKIGSNCCVTQGCQILCHDYSWSVLRRSHDAILPDPGKEVVIGDNVFLGWNTIVLGGVHVGSNVIIGANSVVTHDIPSNMVYAGNPARPVCTLQEYYLKLKEKELDNAFLRAKHIHDMKGRDPLAKEMGWFGVLYLKRDGESESYLRSLGFNGDSIDEVMQTFFHIAPVFPSYEAFLEAARERY